MIRIENAGIYNSQISRKNIKKSNNRRVSLFELELPIENDGISYINKTAMPINQNTIICAKPNQIRCTKFPFKCYYIHLMAEDLNLYNKLLELPDFIQIENRSEYEAIFKALCGYYNTYNKRDEIMMISLVLKLIYLLDIKSQKHITGEYHAFNSSVNKVLKYINENIEEDLSLKKMSAYASLTPTYFHTCFKQVVGKTLREYVEDTRIKHSVNLMLTTNMTLTEIAYHSGFSSQSYYNSVFKRKFDCSPRKYLKILNNKYEV